MAKRVIPDLGKTKEVFVCDWCSKEGTQDNPLGLYGHTLLSNLQMHQSCYSEFKAHERRVFGLDKWVAEIKPNLQPIPATANEPLPDN